jgi:hypothetical protein
MLEKIEALKEEALEALRAASGLDDLDRWRVEYLGRKGGASSRLKSDPLPGRLATS